MTLLSAARLSILVISGFAVMVWLIAFLRRPKIRYASVAAIAYSLFLFSFFLVAVLRSSDCFDISTTVLNSWSLGIHAYSLILILGMGVAAAGARPGRHNGHHSD